MILLNSFARTTATINTIILQSNIIVKTPFYNCLYFIIGLVYVAKKNKRERGMCSLPITRA